MHGFRLDVETHIITGAVSSIQNLTKCIYGLGIGIEDLVLEPLASAEAVLTPEEMQSGIMLVDIGGGTTDIAVYKDNSIYHTAVLPVAGYQVTKDLSVGLDLPFEIAEEMKKKYATVLPIEQEKSDSEDVINENGHSVSYNNLSEIVRIRVEELIRLIMMELPRANYSALIPSGIVFTGGSSNLPGIAELGEVVSRLPVRVGKPTGFYGVGDVLNNPAYATSVGLLLWKKRKEGTQSWRPRSGVRRFLFQVLRLFR
jgi:cell division protein FtsA